MASVFLSAGRTRRALARIGMPTRRIGAAAIDRKLVPLFSSLLCGLVLLFPAPAPAHAADLSAGPSYPYFRQVRNESGPTQARLLLAVAIVDGRESQISIALRRAPGDGAYGVSLETLAKVLGVAITAGEDGGFSVDTPLGKAAFTAAEVTADRGGNFVDMSMLASRLGCRMRFDESEFALIVDTGWRDLPAGQTQPALALPIDVHAPNLSLSRWRTELVSQYAGGDITSTAITDLGGALGPGYWQAQILDGIDHRPRVGELFWVMDRGPSRWLIGQQRVAINPLLPGFDLSGVQMAYTNSPEYLYSQSPLSGQIVPYAASPLTVVEGEGPAGGIAELQLDGQVLMRQTIGLDGRYEFRNVPASTVNAIRLEVAIYEFRDVGVPMRIDRVYAQASNLQLPEGTWVSYAGAGLNGRRLDSLDTAGGSAGFYQFRYGLSPALTVDAVIQGIDGNRYGSVGAAASLGPLGAWAMYGARNSEGGGAWSVLGEGGRNGWFWHAYAQHFDAGFNEGLDLNTSDGAIESRSVEFGRMLGRRARISLVHGQRTDAFGETIEYTKPALDWRPLDSLSLSARPDYQGDYSYAASWHPGARSHVGLTRYGDRTEAMAEYDFNSGYRLMATRLHQDELGERSGLFLRRQAFGARHLSWTLGALQGDGETGYYIEGGMEVRPGLHARLDVLKDPLIRTASESSPTVTLNLVADFAVTGSGLARGSYNVALQQVGGISGALGGDLPAGLRQETLAHVGVSLNGQIRGETDAAGRFYIGDLKPGVYRVGLEPDNLPIELSASGSARNVEVRSGATTRADFRLELLLGCAGRVQGFRDPGRLRIALVDMEGQLIDETRLSDSGFYRADGLQPGAYRILLHRGDRAVPLASLPLKLTDRFEFGLDFQGGDAEAGTPIPTPSRSPSDRETSP